MSINDEWDIEGLKRVGTAVAAARDAMGWYDTQEHAPGIKSNGAAASAAPIDTEASPP